METKNKIVDTPIAHVFRTSDYSIFKRLDGNRAVTSARAKKLKNSMAKNGYIFSPIIVNEFFEVIDGGGRLEALQQLGLPVEYIICPGLRLKDCIVLNAYTSIWTMSDYIDSYCEQGNENYLRLRSILSDYDDLGVQVVLMISSGRASVQTAKIKAGRLNFTRDDADDARRMLTVARRFYPVLKHLRGTPIHYLYALLFAVRMGCSESRLLQRMEQTELRPVANLKAALDTVSEVYNYHLHDVNKRVYLNQLYEQNMCDKYGWYGKRWKDRGGVDADDAATG